MKKVAFPLILFAAFVLCACDVQVGGNNGFSLGIAEGRATDEWTRTYDLAPGGRLEIVNTNGLIEATGTGGKQVEVRAERRARAGTQEEAAELLKQIDMREDVTPTSVRIEARSERTRIGGFGRRRFDVQYHVQVPAGLTVSFRTSNGGIRLQNVNGQIIASTTNGGITGNALSGGLDVEVVNGGIQIDLASVTSDVKVESVNGGIRLDLPVDVKADLDASCVNGGINIDEQFKVDTTAQESRRRVTGALNGGGPRVSVETVNGGIRIRARGRSET
jgi:hypothetical protein